MENKLNEIRRTLDARLTDIGALPRTRELSLASTTGQQGRMLLGVTLGLLGAATPYPQSDNSQSPEIAPAADTAGDYTPALPADPVAAVKTIRAGLGEVLAALDKAQVELFPRRIGTDGYSVFDPSLAETAFGRAYTEIALSKNWLGMELAAIARGDRHFEANSVAATGP